MATDVTGTDSSNSSISLKAVEIVHADGTKETVYIQSDNSGTEQGMSFQTKLTIIYVLVGTIALTLSGYFTYMQIKANKK